MTGDPRLTLLIRREALASRYRDLLVQARSREAADTAAELRHVTHELLREEAR